jgi:hypothetical protein
VRSQPRRGVSDVATAEPVDERLLSLEAAATTPAMRRAYALLRQSQDHLARADVHIAAAERTAATSRG